MGQTGSSVSVLGTRQNYYFWKAYDLLITAFSGLHMKSVAFPKKIGFKTQFLPLFCVFPKNFVLSKNHNYFSNYLRQLLLVLIDAK